MIAALECSCRILRILHSGDIVRNFLAKDINERSICIQRAFVELQAMKGEE